MGLFVRVCEGDAAGGKAKLAIVSMSAWQLTLPHDRQ